MTMLRRFLCAGAAALACAAAGAQTAAPAAASAPAALKPAPKAAPKPADKPTWNQLTPAQQTALAPLHGEWDALAGLRKQKWLELANRFASMKPEEQARVHERMRDWVKLTPAQRNLARQNYTESKKLAPNEKSATWESYKQLPEEEKQKLAEQAVRKPLVNPAASKASQRPIPAIQHGAAACPAGTVKNPASATPACVAQATAPVTPAR